MDTFLVEKERITVNVSSKSADPEPQDQPLFFHLTYSKIGTGVINKSTGDLDVTYIPAYVALTNNKEWVIGVDHIKAATGNYIEKYWTIGEFFRTSIDYKPDQEISIEVDNEKLKITLQFLLALFFVNVKGKLQQQYQRIFTMSMIAVPFWFPSSQRRQILEAAQIAGFDSANLLNENSSAVYFMFSGGIMDSSNSNALIISENSSRVDMSLYFYNKDSMKLKMRGHTGDYEEDLKNVSNVSGAQSWPVIGVLITIAKAIGSQFTKKSAEENGVKKLREKLAHMCSYSHSNKMVSPISNNYKREVVIMTETTEWLSLLAKVGEQVHPISFRDSSRLAILGLASIFKAMKNGGRKYGSIIKDGVPFYLNIYLPNGGKRLQLQRKSQTLAREPKFELESIFDAVEGPFRVVQENASWKMPIGLLIIKKLRPECTHIKISVERTRDGIFELKNVEWWQITMSNIKIKKGGMESDEYSWEAEKMSTDRLNRYYFYLNSVYPNSGRLEKLKDLKEKTISCAQELEAIVTQGKGSFPNEMVRALALNNIRETGKFLEGLGSELSEDVIKQKIKLLDCLKHDYKIL